MSLLDNDHFILGIFGPNVSSGIKPTKVPERWNNSWSNNVKIAQMAEEAGIDFILPVARWIGHGGETNFEGDSLECATWAAGLVALTKKINIVVTTHTTVHHPVAAAKQLATIDAISPGRVSINIVAGWNAPGYAALGLQLPATHEQRYSYAAEWCRIVRRLWTEENWFNFSGEFWTLKHHLASPRPQRQPIVLNAAGSGFGREFAVQNADVLFTVTADAGKSKADIVDLKAKAEAIGRKVEVMTTCYVVCRPTENEAREYVEYYVRDNADWEAAEILMHGLITNSRSFPPHTQEKLRESLAAGHGSFPLVGTPRQVADGLLELHQAGFVGSTVLFVNFIDEFPYFRDEVLPLLEQAISGSRS